MFELDDIVVEYQPDRGGIVVANVEATLGPDTHHPDNTLRGHQSFTEADVSSGDAIRTKIQRGGSYMNETNRQQFAPSQQDTQQHAQIPNGNVDESPRKRLERLLRTPTMDLSTSREIEVAGSLPPRSRSMSPHDIHDNPSLNHVTKLRKTDTIRNPVNNMNQEHKPMSLGAFNIPVMAALSLGGGDDDDEERRGKGFGRDDPSKGLYQSKLERDFDVNKELLEIAEKGDHIRLEEFLKEQAGIVDVNYKQLYKYHAYYPDILIPDAKTPLTCAVRSQSLQCVELLIKDGAKVTTNHKEILYDPEHALSLSPLAASVKLKHRKIAEFLVEKGADIRITFILLSNVFDPFLFKIFEANNVDALSPSRGNLSRSKPPDLDGLKELIHPDILCAWPSPIDIAFKVSKAFEFMKGIKEEYRKDFAALACQCDKFAYDFLSQCQTPNEARDLLGRAGFLDEAMDANKKEFVAHPLSQQLLKMEWQKGDAAYLGSITFSGWIYTFLRCFTLPFLIPFTFVKFMFSNESIKKSNLTRMVELINVPVYCFMVHATSSILFLIFLLFICNEDTHHKISIAEYILWTFVMGRVLVETQQIQRTRMTEYLSSMWNIVDIISLILFLTIVVMRTFLFIVFHKVTSITHIESKAGVYAVPKLGIYTENDLLAVVNIMYSLNSIIACTRLLPLFEASYSLGPLQLTMGGMLADLAKVLCLLVTVILAFSLGTTKLYNSRFYYLYIDASKLLEDQKMAFSVLPENIKNFKCFYEDNLLLNDYNCSFSRDMIKPAIYKNFGITLVTLFWALFGLIVPGDIQKGNKDTVSDTLGKVYFGVYMTIAAILLINILIAMINNTYKKVIDNSDVEWKFARASLVQEFKEAHPIMPPLNIITVSSTFIAKFIIFTCGSDRAKRAIEHLLVVSGAESEDNVREKNEAKSNKASPSSSKLSEAEKSCEKIEVEVFEQPKVDILQQVLIRMLVKRYKKSGMSRKMQRMVIAVVGDEVMTLPSTGDIDEEIEDDIKELKIKLDSCAGMLEKLTFSFKDKMDMVCDKMTALENRSTSPGYNPTQQGSPRKLPLPRLPSRPKSSN